MQIKTALALSAAMLLSNGVTAQTQSGNNSGTTSTQSGSQSGSGNQSGQTSQSQTGSSSQTGNQTSNDQNSQGQQGNSGTQSGSSATGQTGQSGNSSGQRGSATGGQRNASGRQQAGAQSSGSNMSGGSSAGMLNSQDREFVQMAAMGGTAEVEMARLALQKASSDAVKQYAQKMIDDHTKANEELMRIAGNKGISLPGDMSMMSGSQMGSQSSSGTTSQGGGQTSSTSANSGGSQSGSASGGSGSGNTSKMMDMHQKHMAVMSRLQGLSGAQFDREYINQAGNKDHEQQAKLFERQASKGGDSDLKSFAASTLPIVQGHLSMARDLSKTIKGGSSNSNNSSGKSSNNSSTSSSNNQ